MKRIAQVLTAAALVFAVATPALAAKVVMTPAQRKEIHAKQTACKTEAKRQ